MSSEPERPVVRSSIIVDPGLIEEAKRLSERPLAADANDEGTNAPTTGDASEHSTPSDASDEGSAMHTNGVSGASVDALDRMSGETPAEELDHITIEDAERFASAFRPSWEPVAPIAARVSVPAAAVVSAPEEPARRVAISELPGAHQRSSWLMAGGAVAAFFVLAAIGWATTHSEATEAAAKNAAVPEPAKNAQPPAPEPAPSAPEAVAAPAPVAAPEPAPVADAIEAPTTPTAEPAPSGEVAAAATPEPATPQPAAVEAAAPAPEPEPVLVALQITTSPREAQLLLDGAPVPNPFDAQLPKGTSYRVEAAAPGYSSSNLTIDLNRERRVALKLQPERSAEPAQADAPKPARARARPRPAAREKAPKKGAGFVEESPY